MEFNQELKKATDPIYQKFKKIYAEEGMVNSCTLYL